MTNKTNLGIGRASGMAYIAPAGTALPTDPRAIPDSPWTEIGAVSEDGISFSPNRDFETLRNWAKEIERLMPPDDDETLEVPFMHTTEGTMKMVFGEDSVTVTEATAEHGKRVSVNIDPTMLPEDHAYVFFMKDGDDALMIGTEKGFITSVGDVSFSPSDAIIWTATIAAKSWTFVKDDGQVA